jgi:hypothetical protein
VGSIRARGQDGRPLRPRRLSVWLFDFIHFVFIVFIDLLEVLSCLIGVNRITRNGVAELATHEVAEHIKEIDKVVENAGLFFAVFPVRLK